MSVTLSVLGTAHEDWLADGDEFVRYHQEWAARIMVEQRRLHRMAVLMCRRHPKTGLTQPRPVLVAVIQAKASDEEFTTAVTRFARRGEAIAQLVASEAWMRLAWQSAADRSEVLALSFQHPQLGAGMCTAEVIRGDGGTVGVGAWTRMMNEGPFEWSGRLMDVLPTGGDA